DDIVTPGKRLAQGGGGGIGAARPRAEPLDLAEQLLDLGFEEGRSLALDGERRQQLVDVFVIVAAKAIAALQEARRKGGANGFARSLELLGLRRKLLVASAEPARQLRAFALEVEHALAQYLLAFLELAHRHHVLVAFALERGEIGPLAADIAKLLGQTLAQGFDIHLEPARGQRELGPELILVGAELGKGDRGGGFDPLAGQPYGTAPDGWENHEHDQRRRHRAQGEIHHALDAHPATPQPRDTTGLRA